MATHTPSVQINGRPSTADEGELRTSADANVTHDGDILESESANLSNGAKKVYSFIKRFIRRISNTVIHAFTPSSTTNIQNLPESSAEELMPLTDCVTTTPNNNNITELDSPRPPVTRSETLLDRTADDPGQTPSPWSDRATSPEVCSWISSRPLQEEIGWIFASSSTGSRSSKIYRIAGCLRRALWHTYVTPAEEYGEPIYPGHATGTKKRYMFDPPLSRFKRGAKGLKKRGDTDVPVKRFVPNGLKLRPLNDKLFATVGCFFPQPSKMRYVEVADYSAVNKDGGSGQENVLLPAVAGEAPTDYHGPAKDYAGSLSSDSDSSDSD